MGPLFTDTVTAYHRTREGRADIWTRRELRGVQWRQKTVRTALANEAGKILYAAETTVTIPAPAARCPVKISIFRAAMRLNRVNSCSVCTAVWLPL